MLFLQLSAIDRHCVFILQVKVLRYTLSTVAICQVFLYIMSVIKKKLCPLSIEYSDVVNPWSYVSFKTKVAAAYCHSDPILYNF